MAGFTGWKRQQGRYKKSTQKKAQLITGHGIVTAWGDVRQTAPGVWCCYRAAAVPATAVPATTTAAAVVDSNASHRRLPAIDFPQECHGPYSIQLPPGKLVAGPDAHDVGTPVKSSLRRSDTHVAVESGVGHGRCKGGDQGERSSHRGSEMCLAGWFGLAGKGLCSDVRRCCSAVGTALLLCGRVGTENSKRTERTDTLGNEFRLMGIFHSKIWHHRSSFPKRLELKRAPSLYLWQT